MIIRRDSARAASGHCARHRRQHEKKKGVEETEARTPPPPPPPRTLRTFQVPESRWRPYSSGRQRTQAARTHAPPPPSASSASGWRTPRRRSPRCWTTTGVPQWLPARRRVLPALPRRGRPGGRQADPAAARGQVRPRPRQPAERVGADGRLIREAKVQTDSKGLAMAAGAAHVEADRIVLHALRSNELGRDAGFGREQPLPSPFPSLTPPAPDPAPSAQRELRWYRLIHLVQACVRA